MSHPRRTAVIKVVHMQPSGCMMPSISFYLGIYELDGTLFWEFNDYLKNNELHKEEDYLESFKQIAYNHGVAKNDLTIKKEEDAKWQRLLAR